MITIRGCAIIASLAATLLCSGCDADKPSADAVSTFESQRPADEQAFLAAFTEYDDATLHAPNPVAAQEARKIEGPKLCATISGFRHFENWTAEVRQITKSSDDSNVLDVDMTLNGSVFAYIVHAKVRTDSSLYPLVVSLKDGLNGEPVVISGTVNSTSGVGDFYFPDDKPPCPDVRDFNVRLDSIAPI
jgi:hypothetical protein